ncbi:MAG TPA: VOC family protein [Blastocatellia bacterium]|nr:VOC family protein [Blastocatellia bacterium]
MDSKPKTTPNVKQAVPFFLVSNIDESVRFYVDGLGFRMTKNWIDDGKLRWCWLEHGDAALMLQEFRYDGPNTSVPRERLGVGVSICFICEDAITIYRDVVSRGVDASRPFVGNGMWVTSMTDPNGYRIDFESRTDVAEETEWRDSDRKDGVD